MSDEEKKIKHNLEELFNIEEASTSLPIVYEPKENVEAESYDNKDKEIDDQYQEIYNAAMESFYAQMDDVHVVDPKYKARTGEIGVQLLQAALNAAQAKANLKQTKEKMEISAQKATGPKTLNQNLIVDRNDLLKMLSEEPAEPIDYAEFEEVEAPEDTKENGEE